MKPLIFSTRSVRAWQTFAKTQTRRLVKPQPERDDWKPWQDDDGCWWWWERHLSNGFHLIPLRRQPYAPSDLLWIREALKRGKFGYVLYAANALDYLREEDEGLARQWPSHWKRDKLPAMFMPRFACRYYAGVVSVRAEQLQDISDEDAIAEGTLVGLDLWSMGYPKISTLYFDWWKELHRKLGTRVEDNPVLWRYVLEPVDKPAEMC